MDRSFHKWRGNRGRSVQRRGVFKGPKDGSRFFNHRPKAGPWQGRMFDKRDPTPLPKLKRLSEEEIGVTEYVSSHKGFNGIIKSRYSDFQVSEINEAGEVAKLTDMVPPEPPVQEGMDEDEDILFEKYNLEILPMETWDRIHQLSICPHATDETVQIDATEMSKEQRTKIHDAVKKAFTEAIVGSTVTVDDKKYIKFQKYRKGVRIDTRVKWAWPGEYVYFVVHKQNCDTIEAAGRIAERIGLSLKPSLLGYAGTKDRRAASSQWFSARKVPPQRIAAGCRGIRDVHVGNYSFRGDVLKLGMLRGNRFRIALRNVTASDAEVDEACTLLKERGFINYYGLQRFGTRPETPTYKIGIYLLQGKLKEAVDSILEERSGPLEDALRSYVERGARSAYGLVPRRAQRNAPEARLLKALAAAPNDYAGAVNALPRNTRLLYLHSYQSLIWNKAVSERVRRFGLTPAVGDIVPLDDSTVEEPLIDEILDLLDDETDQDDGKVETFQSKDEIEQGKIEIENKQAKTESDTKTEDARVTNKNQKIKVKVLTQEDIDSGRYSMFDIVMPLPGYNIEYPPNMKGFYEGLLAADGLKLELKHRIKSYSMCGAYRRVLALSSDVTWRTVTYSDPYADLILSDLDELRNNTNTGIISNGKFKAVLLTMSLPTSCYATMALRELMKVDTSGDYQATQNNYHVTDKNKLGSSRDDKNNDLGKQENTDRSNNTDVNNDNGKATTANNSSNVSNEVKDGNVIDNTDKNKLISSRNYKYNDLGNEQITDSNNTDVNNDDGKATTATNLSKVSNDVKDGNIIDKTDAKERDGELSLEGVEKRKMDVEDENREVKKQKCED